MNGLLGMKLGMRELLFEKTAIPVTLIQAGPCVVIQKKTKDNDGYEALQVGFLASNEKKLNKPLLSHFSKRNLAPMKYLREFRVNDSSGYQLGQSIGVDMFELGEYVDISGISKGKGFQGIMKRWGAKGGAGSHGSMFHRAPGSIGASSDPSRVFKGTIMPGHMGHEKVTVKNLEVIKIEKEDNILIVKGAIPGANGGLVVVEKTGHKKIVHAPSKAKVKAAPKAEKPAKPGAKPAAKEKK